MQQRDTKNNETTRQRDNMIKRLVANIMFALSFASLAPAQEAGAGGELLPWQTAPTPIDSFIRKDAVVKKGFINYYCQDKRHFLEVPDEVIGRDILVMVTISKGAYRKERTQDMRFGYGGDGVFEKMIRLQLANGYIYITQPTPSYLNDTTAINYKYLLNKTAPISHALKMVAQSPTTTLVDVTDMIMDDDALFSLKGAAAELKLGMPQSELTEIKRVEAFPENINFISQRAYTLNEPAKGELNTSLWEVCSSWMLLPEIPMMPKIEDARVGYFTHGLTGLSARNDINYLGAMAAHWRLEPKEEDLQRYLAGEIVEPKKPIIYYIDPATPDYLKPHFIKAVNVWQEAFERAGFKNAIHAEIAPDDSTYNQGDIRYPFISYKASPIPNAYGPHVIDPRSGEIINTHIGIYHSVLDLVQRWYFVMCSPVDKRARKYPLDKEALAEIMETVLTHEVGHTLGLRHNFIGSTAYDADSLRCSDFICRNGLGASIMDYQRFNFIAQPGDRMKPQDLVPHIGEYDKFAIEWAYRYRPNGNLSQQTAELRQWVTDRRAEDPRRLYLVETTLGDCRVLSEDASSDDIKANRYGMKNLQYIMDHIEEWTPVEGKEYFPLRRRYLSVLNQYDNYISHIVKHIASHQDDNCDRNEHYKVNEHLSKAKQMEALEFLDEYLIKEQRWLFRKPLMERTGVDYDNYGIAFATQQLGITLLKYSALNTQSPQDDDLKPQELFDFLYDKIYAEKNKQPSLSYYDMRLQKDFMASITMNAENLVAIQFSMATLLNDMMRKIKEDAMQKAASSDDFLQKNHHLAIANFVTIWEKENNEGLAE